MKNEMIEFYRMESEHMADAIDRIVVEVHTRKRKYDKKVILLSGCGPSAGVTSLSINLSIALSMAGWKTLLLDCDLRKSNKYKRVTEDTTTGLSEYLTKKQNRAGLIRKTNHENLFYIPRGTSEISPVQLLCTVEMEQLMAELREEYDYIIMDSPSLNIVSDNQLLFPMVDGITLVASLKTTTKWQIEDARRIVGEYGDKYYGLIINKVDLKQYKKHIRDYDYFRTQNMEKKYRQDMRKVSKKKTSVSGGNEQ